MAPDGLLEANVTNPSERICHGTLLTVKLWLAQLVTACNHHFLITENNASKGTQQTRTRSLESEPKHLEVKSREADTGDSHLAPFRWLSCLCLFWCYEHRGSRMHQGSSPHQECSKHITVQAKVKNNWGKIEIHTFESINSLYPSAFTNIDSFSEAACIQCSIIAPFLAVGEVLVESRAAESFLRLGMYKTRPPAHTQDKIVGTNPAANSWNHSLNISADLLQVIFSYSSGLFSAELGINQHSEPLGMCSTGLHKAALLYCNSVNYTVI